MLLTPDTLLSQMLSSQTKYNGAGPESKPSLDRNLIY